MPASIPDVHVDSTKHVFAAPETPYRFHNQSHIFSGENTTFFTPDGTELCSLVVKFNYVGELEHGSVKVVGGISSLGIPSQTLLLLGSIVNIDTFSMGGNLFLANFIFRIYQDHPGLGYTSHFGVWKAYMVIPSWPPFYVRYLFRRNWGPKSAPMNSYIGQVATIV